MGSGTRDQTNANLHAEREKADHEFARENVAPEEDALVALLRNRADQSLLRAREAEDARRTGGVDPLPIDARRRAEDATIQTERATEDRTLEVAREARRQTFAALLWGERSRTDASLLAERRHVDRVLSRRDDALAVAIHDLSSLLASVELNALAVSTQTEDDGPDTTLRFATNIQKAVAVMQRLLGDIADATRIETGDLGLRAAPNDARALVREAGEVFSRVADAAGITLDVDAGEAPLWANFDYHRALQVLANLLSNALKFTPKGGRVRLRVRAEPAHLRFEVEDTGPGIPTEHSADIFEKFWQGEGVSGRGVGLGLYIARHIVTAHGGAIGVESPAGRGATFFFTLPA